MTPALSSPRLKKLALGLLGALTVLLLFLWLALPRIIQSQAEKFVVAKTGHRLEMARPEFNPFTLSLRLANLKLAEPDGQPLLAFDALLVDLSIASLPRRGLVFDAIRLDGLQLTLVERAAGGLNWTPFLAALKSKEDEPDAPLPRLEIASLVLAGSHLDFADRRTTPGFATRVEPFDFSLSDISTQPDDSGKFSLAARTAFGAQLRLQGELTLNPFGVAGEITLDDLQLGQLAAYLKNGLPGAPEGKVSLAARYRAGNQGQRLDALVEDIAVKVAGLRVPLAADGAAAMQVAAIDLAGGRFDLANQSLKLARLDVAGGKLDLPGVQSPPSFGALTLENLDVALAERKASLGSVVFRDGRVRAVRNAQGKVDLQEALQAIVAALPKENKPAEPANAPDGRTPPPWRYQVGKIELAGWGLAVRDESLGQPVELALEKLAFSATGLSDDLKAALPVSLGFDVATGGHFEATGKVVPAEAAADIQLKLADLSLKPVQPLLATKTSLRIADGTFATDGRLVFNAKGPDFRGQFDLRKLLIVEADGDTLLAWKSFAGQKLAVTASRLDIGELRLNGLDTKLIIEKDKSINFKSALKSEPASATAPAAAPITATASVPPASTSGVAPPFEISIDRLRFYNGAMFFADHSLVLPFGTRIHGLRGSLSNLNTRPGGAPAQLELEGEVDEFGMARAAGQFDLADPTGFMDIRVLFKNVEMTRLTPYTATFAGRKIDSGKLSLDLQYKLKQRQLQGENQVVIERLTLGERIESPGAADLPLDLAIAILQDSDGRIDLGLPVAGSLDDPAFSYGAIVWKAIRNVLTKIVTAPFRALGALFGGSGEQVEGIVFEAGAATLTPPEREKLERIAAMLAKRPRLQLTLAGLYAEADRVALQDLQLRRTVLTRLGERINEKYDPGPLSTAQPKTRGVLEDLYAERFGASDLAALKEGFRRANPGQLEEGVAGKMMSRLSGLLREKKTLSENEVEQLKGGDFHALLFERLRGKEGVGDEPLRELGKARAEYAFQTLKAAGAAVERMQQAAPEPGDSVAGGVPLKLALEAKQSK